MSSHFLLPDLNSRITYAPPEKARLHILSDFLSLDLRDELLSFALSERSHFLPTSVTTNSERYPDHRNSLVLYDVPKWMCDRILSIVPSVVQELNYPPFPISRMEAQLTAHNDNNYYKIHTDNGCPETEQRKLTFVYYFYRQPKAFDGGELIVYDTKVEGKRPVKLEQKQVLAPAHNSLVFFLSSYLHEVSKVRCPARLFEDGRFTVNGWIG